MHWSRFELTCLRVLELIRGGRELARDAIRLIAQLQLADLT